MTCICGSEDFTWKQSSGPDATTATKVCARCGVPVKP